MTHPANEFARAVRIEAVSDAPSILNLAAEPAEREALARRFDLIAIDRLEATLSIRREGTTLFADGRLSAAVAQPCVATGDPVPASIEESFTLRFIPADEPREDEEIELDAADLDTLTYSGGAVDLGEAVAETLALALDPFPRSANADETLRKAGVLSEEDASPFAKLKGLLGGKDTTE